MEKAQKIDIVPQEGSTECAESLTTPGHSGVVCPSYSGGGNLCSGSGESLDLSGLKKAITTMTPEKLDLTTNWTIVAHKRPCKKGANVRTDTTGPSGQPNRSCPNRRARREAMRSKTKDNVAADAAVETQREPVPSTSKEVVSQKAATTKQMRPPSSAKKSKQKMKQYRGTRGRRYAATAPSAPEKEQTGVGSGSGELTSMKRARLDETQSPRGDAKRAKTDARTRRAMGYADASKSHLRVAIITVPSRDLSTEQADRLRETIDDSILQAVLSPPSQGTNAPSFRGRPFLMDGVLAMWCEDSNALSWLEGAVRTMESPIPNTTLAVIRQSELKKKLRAGLLLHTRITDSATLHKVIRAQNPWYKVDSWQCYDMTVDDQASASKEKVVHLILGIPEDQKQEILNRDRRVAHMSGSGYIRFFSEEATSAEKPAATSAATEDVPIPGTSTSAPQQGPSEMEASPPMQDKGHSSDEEDILRSP